MFQTIPAMEDIISFDTIAQCNARCGQPTHHPLVTALDLSQSPPTKAIKTRFGVYAIYLKESRCGDIRYGHTLYDYQEGTLVFIAPGQTVEIIRENPEEEYYQPSGRALYFHPDLLHGTSLAQNIKDYSFFSYSVREALHISAQEKEIVEGFFNKISIEIERPIDKHSKKLIVSNIDLFLSYCQRFYDRQFITREVMHKNITAKFDNLLNSYYQNGRLQQEGLPTVAYCAGKLCLSYKYFGDLVKKETGKTAQEYIQLWVLDLAKNRLAGTTQSVSEIAYELGFEYPQHFTRLFRQKTGHTPSEYRLTY